MKTKIAKIFFTGSKCDHAHAVCQYELEKAIKKIKGEWREKLFQRS